MLILGEDEENGNTVSIRIDRKGDSRSGDQCNGVHLEQFITDLTTEVNSRSLRLSLVTNEN
jgi:threonyl-tRNA synthetase